MDEHRRDAGLADRSGLPRDGDDEQAAARRRLQRAERRRNQASPDRRARGDEPRLRSRGAVDDGARGEGRDGERDDRGHRRQGLLQGRGDRRLRAGRHRRHGLEAAHVERRGGRAASTRPTSSTTPTSDAYRLSCRRVAHLPLHERGGRKDDALTTGRTRARAARSKHRCTTGKERRVRRWEHEDDPRARPEAARRRSRARSRCAARPSSIPSARSRPGWARRTSR